jgi:hypothetical protein
MKEHNQVVSHGTTATSQLPQNTTYNNNAKQKNIVHESSASPVCYPFARLALNEQNRTIRRIYFAHMRKAGGTTLRAYLKGAAETLGIDFDVSEGGHFEAPGSDPHTLYVTHLRDPFKRSISHFQYEVRWPCSQMVQNASFVPSWDNAANLTAWISERHYLHPSLGTMDDSTNRRCDDAQKYLTDCSTNCYIRWMNFPKGACAEQIFEPKSVYYYKALQSLRNYDVIIDIDRLFSDAGAVYAADLERWFGQEGLQSKNSPMYCLRASRNANRNFPLKIDNTTRNLFVEKNLADFDLHEALVTCETASNQVVFPDKGGGSGNSLANFVPTIARN